MTLLFGKSSVLTISQGINLLLSLGITILLTRSLTLASFGVYTLFLIIVSMVSLIIDFGLNEASSQDLAELQDASIVAERIGHVFILGAAICALFSIALLLASFCIDSVFQVQAGRLFRDTWWLLFFVPLYELTKAVCRGCGYVNRWSVVNILPRLIFLIFLFLLKELDHLDLSNVGRTFALSYFISGVFSVLLLKPVFRFRRGSLTDLLHKVKSFGFNIMIGVSVFNLTVFLDRLFISMMINSAALAVYQMAVAFANPIVLFSRSIGISTFRDAVGEKTISRRLNLINFLSLVTQAVLVYTLMPFVLQLFSLEKYLPALDLLPWILIAHIFLGLKQPYGFLFIARKKGKVLMKIALITASFSFFSLIILIWIFELSGAAMALVFSYALLFFAHVFYTRKEKL